MSTIKIKFKDNITYPASNTNYDISFTSNGKSYHSFYFSMYSGGAKYIWYVYGSDVTFSDTACDNIFGWKNPNFQYIEIDTNQPNFQTFINAMKSNIEGVLLESGTYVWNNEQPFWGGDFPTSAERKIVKFNFTSNNIQFASCGVSLYSAGEFHFE